MAGENGFLWQVQASAVDGTKDTAGSDNYIAFNDTGKVPSSGAYITNIDVDFRRAVPENEAVNADNNEIQDMGIGGLDIIITGVSGNADNDSDTTNPINKLRKWIKEGNTATSYTKGRYGLQLDNAPQWNVIPNADKGGTGGDYG